MPNFAMTAYVEDVATRQLRFYYATVKAPFRFIAGLFLVLNLMFQMAEEKNPDRMYRTKFSHVHQVSQNAEKVIFFFGITEDDIGIFVGDRDATLSDAHAIAELKKLLYSDRTGVRFLHHAMPVR
ncbi:MAG: hypothetical protein ACOZAO_00550 [Patescibacteria group bacterium]